MAEINTGNTAWLLVSSAFVFFMIPGLALFYGGMTGRKNVLATIMQSIFMLGLISMEWIIVGYTLAFGTDFHGFIGLWDKLGLTHVLGHVMQPAAIPEMAFVGFQGMFAAITPALISGAVVGRIRFGAFAIFALVWSLFIYNPVAHWVWGGGFLAKMGALDFAGGLVIHILSGVSALVLCIILGKRYNYKRGNLMPHHLPMTVLGASMLWFGWFGFNGGSALGANELAALALMNTQVAAGAGLIGWALMDYVKGGKMTVLGAISGAISGLVSITPAAGYVTPLSSIAIGLIGAVICYFAVVTLKYKLGYDDALDAFGIHGVGGTWGAIATGIFATTTVNPDGANGLLYGDIHLLGVQALSVVIAYVVGAVGTIIIYKVLSHWITFRVSREDERLGLDLSEHGESAYNSSELKIM